MLASSCAVANSRIVSSIRIRGPGAAEPCSATSRLCSLSRSSAVSTSDTIASAAHRLGGLERPATDEHGESRQQRPLRRVEEVVAPLDGRRQRALALGKIGDAAADDVELPAQALQERRGIEDAHARSGELDREGQAVEAAADLLDDLELVGRRGPVRPRDGGPFEKQPDRCWAPERRYRKLGLPANPERRAARHHEIHAWAALEQLGDDGPRLDDLLEVVQHEECTARREPILDRRQERASTLAAETEGRRDRTDHLIGCARVGERHEEHAVRIGIGGPGGAGDAEPCLSDATGACQREEADVVPLESLRGVRDLVFAAHENGELRREVDRPRSAGSRRLQLAREPGRVELKQLLGAVEPLEGERAELRQLPAV